VLVTGHTGFKGGWLCGVLGGMDAAVAGYSLPPPTSPSFHDAVGLAGRVDETIGDVRDLATLTAALERTQPEVVFHLAAQPLVRRAFNDPVETYSTNVMGTVNLMEAVRRTPSVRAVVVVTSDKVYDNVEWVWSYREPDRLGGREPYGTSKAACELVVEAYRNSYRRDGLAIATVRAGNIIGGGDWAEDRLIPDAVRAFSKGQPLIIRNPAAVRPWQHVLEPVAGYMMLAEKLLAGDLSFEGGWNFGPSYTDARPVSEVVNAVAELWGDGVFWQLANGAQPYEAKLLTVDSSQAITRLKWVPRWNLAGALRRTVDWYKAFLSGSDMLRVTETQIREFLYA
jgi:CDP-glucose 4,6-dehydratase